MKAFFGWNEEEGLFRKMNRLIYVNDSPPPQAHNPRLDFKDMRMENKFLFMKGNDLHSSARGQQPTTKAVMRGSDGTFKS